MLDTMSTFNINVLTHVLDDIYNDIGNTILKEEDVYSDRILTNIQQR